MNSYEKNEIEVFDFLNFSKQDFVNGDIASAVLVQGQHLNPAPLVDIIITTNNRPNLLKQALESAINQKEFDDYQIIVVDNEAKPICAETLTSKLINQYSDKKIVYYRNTVVAKHITNSAVSHSVAKWFCVLHDDDILSQYHLKIMSTIVEDSDIHFVSCPVEKFIGEKKDEVDNVHKVIDYRLRTCPAKQVLDGYQPGWLGAFVRRKDYIDMGGTPFIELGMTDYCMVNIFHYRFGISELLTDYPLYYRRINSVQNTALGNWEKIYRNEFYFHKYLAQRTCRLFASFWCRIAIYRIVSKARNLSKEYSTLNLDEKRIIESCNMSTKLLNKSLRYYSDMALLRIYRFICTMQTNYSSVKSITLG